MQKPATAHASPIFKKSVEVYEVLCWKTASLIKIRTLTTDIKSVREVQSVVELFVSVVGWNSPYFLGKAEEKNSDDTKALVVSAKGSIANHGRELWNGGFKVALDSVMRSLTQFACDFIPRVSCPGCLARLDPPEVCSWGSKKIADIECSDVHCVKGHRVDISSIRHSTSLPSLSLMESCFAIHVKVPIETVLPGVVLICLRNKKTGEILECGSGFIADKYRGLIVTAAHCLFDMEPGGNFGSLFFGCTDAEVLIGVVQDTTGDAEFRFTANVVAHNVEKVDALILRVTTCLQRAISPDVLRRENHQPLSLSYGFRMNEPVLLVGFNQGGEGIIDAGNYPNRTPDCAGGNICRRWESSALLHSDSEAAHCLTPYKEFVAICPNIRGLSGGPFVNSDGKVVGILSRSEREGSRCYLVPSSEIAFLLRDATTQIRVEENRQCVLDLFR